MTTRKDFSEAAQADIIDSLMDARDNAEEGYALTEAEVAAQMAYAFGSTLHAFQGEAELSYSALGLIREALSMSIQNCVDLGLDDAEHGYGNALAEAISLGR